MFFFFFNQKTAYEMRISDWSSDVCSSDLAITALSERMKLDQLRAVAAVPAAPSGGLAEWPTMASQPAAATEKPDAEPRSWAQRISALHRSSVDLTSELPVLETSAVPLVRSEEHTSELQSLMRISYAVSCLQKTHMKNS